MDKYNNLIDDLVKMERENPNDYTLGELIRQYIKEKNKEKSNE